MNIHEYLETVNQLETKKEYMHYEITYPVHIDEYININTDDWSCPNPILYQIVVPLTQEFYYKGKKYRWSDECWNNIWPHGLMLVDDFKNGYSPTYFNLQEIKENIVNIHDYNCSRIYTLRQYAEKVEHHLAMGNIDGTIEEIFD